MLVATTVRDTSLVIGVAKEGEVSVFDPGPASATVRASSEAEVWRITKDSLDRLHQTNPKVAYRLVTRITTCLSKRLRLMNDKVVDLANR